VRAGILGLGRRVEITASCTKSLETVTEPEIGCSLCHADLGRLGENWEVV